jgi:hypothetical protein
MNIAAWLLYVLAIACVGAGLIALSPPLAVVALGLLLGRTAFVVDKEDKA